MAINRSCCQCLFLLDWFYGLSDHI